MSEDEELKLLQRLVKQRKESAAIYTEQGREDLAQPELDQASVIEQFLPEQLSEEEIEKEVEHFLESWKAHGADLARLSARLFGSDEAKEAMLAFLSRKKK